MKETQFFYAQAAECFVDVDFETAGLGGNREVGIDVGYCGADKQSKIADCLCLRQTYLLLETGRGGGGRNGVGHIQHGRHAAGECSACAGMEILFLGVARFSEMDVRINEAGQA